MRFRGHRRRPRRCRPRFRNSERQRAQREEQSAKHRQADKLIMLLLFQANTLFNLADLQMIAPELILSVIACVVLVMEVILPYKLAKVTAYFSLIGIALAFASLFLLWSGNRDNLPLTGFYGMIRIDGFAIVFKGIFLISAALRSEERRVGKEC